MHVCACMHECVCTSTEKEVDKGLFGYHPIISECDACRSQLMVVPTEV